MRFNKTFRDFRKGTEVFWTDVTNIAQIEGAGAGERKNESDDALIVFNLAYNMWINNEDKDIAREQRRVPINEWLNGIWEIYVSQYPDEIFAQFDHGTVADDMLHSAKNRGATVATRFDCRGAPLLREQLNSWPSEGGKWDNTGYIITANSGGYKFAIYVHGKNGIGSVQLDAAINDKAGYHFNNDLSVTTNRKNIAEGDSRREQGSNGLEDWNEFKKILKRGDLRSPQQFFRSILKHAGDVGQALIALSAMLSGKRIVSMTHDRWLAWFFTHIFVKPQRDSEKYIHIPLRCVFYISPRIGNNIKVIHINEVLDENAAATAQIQNIISIEKNKIVKLTNIANNLSSILYRGVPIPSRIVYGKPPEVPRVRSSCRKCPLHIVHGKPAEKFSGWSDIVRKNNKNNIYNSMKPLKCLPNSR